MQEMIPSCTHERAWKKGGRELTRVQVTVGKAVSAVSSVSWGGRRRLWNPEPRGALQKDTPRHIFDEFPQETEKKSFESYNQSLQELICLKWIFIYFRAEKTKCVKRSLGTR